ncbi:M14 family metallopeptidase [Candidatus Accumulibacter aalborgensis]
MSGLFKSLSFMLTVLETLPNRFLTTPARELYRLLPGPTLIHLAGRRATPLFVSALLHGNEDSGVVALQSVLLNHAHRPLPRALSILVGNVAAAREGLRRLDHQPDYNRVWPGTDRHADAPEHAAMSEVHRRMQARGLFASIDIHNNTGINPHYCVVNRLDQPVLQLALLFSRTVVWFRGLPGSQTTAFSPLCPALTVECGKPGSPANEEHAARFIEACLHLAQFPVHDVHEHDIDLYHTVATVRVPSAISFDFGGGAPADIHFDEQLDHMNFRHLDPGSAFGTTRREFPLDVRDESGRDVAAEFFDCSGGVIRLRRASTPAMLTLDARAVRQDCLCYLMERLPLPQRESEAAARPLCASL